MPVSALMVPTGDDGRPGSVVSGGIARGKVPASSRSRTLSATVFLSTCRSLHARSVAPAHLAHDLIDATDGGANARGVTGRVIRRGGHRAIGAAEDRRRPYRDLGVVGEHVTLSRRGSMRRSDFAVSGLGGDEHYNQCDNQGMGVVSVPLEDLLDGRASSRACSF